LTCPPETGPPRMSLLPPKEGEGMRRNQYSVEQIIASTRAGSRRARSSSHRRRNSTGIRTAPPARMRGREGSSARARVRRTACAAQHQSLRKGHGEGSCARLFRARRPPAPTRRRGHDVPADLAVGTVGAEGAGADAPREVSPEVGEPGVEGGDRVAQAVAPSRPPRARS
jgi:hypothetical protein